MYQFCGATMWRRAMPALSNTPDRRSNRAFLPPNASRARIFASDCSTTNGGTAVARESRLHGRMGTFPCKTGSRNAPMNALMAPHSADITQMEQEVMTRSLIQIGMIFELAACGAAPSAGQQPSGDPPFVTREVATFDSPWAMDFLPGTSQALVTEKP